MWLSIQRNSSHLFIYCAGKVCLSVHSLVSVASQTYCSWGFYDARLVLQYLCQNYHMCCAVASLPFPSIAKKHTSFFEGEGYSCAALSVNQSVTLHATMRWSHYNAGKATLHIRRNSLQGSICFWALCLLDRLCFSRFGHFSILLRSPTRNM